VPTFVDRGNDAEALTRKRAPQLAILTCVGCGLVAVVHRGHAGLGVIQDLANDQAGDSGRSHEARSVLSEIVAAEIEARVVVEGGRLLFSRRG